MYSIPAMPFLCEYAGDTLASGLAAGPYLLFLYRPSTETTGSVDPLINDKNLKYIT